MEQIQEIKETYYEYVSKLSNGCLTIANLIRRGNYSDAFESIVAFSEGMQWLSAAEQALNEQGLTINSRTAEANEFLAEINAALEGKDMVTVADLFEYEIQALFSSATEWIFSEKSEG